MKVFEEENALDQFEKFASLNGPKFYDLPPNKEKIRLVSKLNQIPEFIEVTEKNGITIIGDSTILNKLPTSASNLYAKNLFNFVLNLYDKENNKININMEDEIINKTIIK